MKKFRANSSQHGFTLIELMIAMLIGVFLMAGVIQIFLSAKQAYRLQENLSRLQENGRLAIDTITKDIRMAGYVNSACVPVTPPLPAPFAQADTANNWCTTNPDKKCVVSTASNTVNNIRTDVIRSFQWANLNLLPAAAPNCPPTAANQSEVSYFIRLDDSNSNMPALWRWDGATSQERVEGIENMQVLYGVDTSPIEDTNNNATLDNGEDVNGNGVLDPDYVPNYYVDASKIPTTIGTVVADWSRVVSVRITVLAVTPDNGLVASNNNLTDAPQPYTFNGVTTTPPDVCSFNGVIVSTTLPCSTPNIQVKDLRIRRVFSSTIAVRNRLP